VVIVAGDALLGVDVVSVGVPGAHTPVVGSRDAHDRQGDHGHEQDQQGRLRINLDLA